ncbi:MAG: hypothetical protein WCJ86_02900 [Candidatus Saccharibacteria bacterium]
MIDPNSNQSQETIQPFRPGDEIYEDIIALRSLSPGKNAHKTEVDAYTEETLNLTRELNTSHIHEQQLLHQSNAANGISETRPKILAEDISVETILTDNDRAHLSDKFQFGPGYLEKRLKKQKALAVTDLNKIEIAINMSRPERINLDRHNPQDRYYPIYDHMKDRSDLRDYPVTGDTKAFEDAYEEARSDPAQKAKLDFELVDSFIRKLGPANPLRRNDGYSAEFELAKMKKLLENDYENLDDSDKLSEYKMTIAIISEELALLWSPNRINDRLPVGDSNDSTTEKASWREMGIELSKEAADRFQEIYEDKGADRKDALQAQARSVDMRVRELRLRALPPATKEAKGAYMAKIRQLSEEQLEIAEDNYNNRTKIGIKEGYLFELLVLARKRENIHSVKSKHAYDHLIRLSLPREDQVHKDIKPLRNMPRIIINLSSDIVIEDINGKRVGAYQVKAMTEQDYNDPSKKPTPPIYTSEMIFKDPVSP